MGNSTNQTGGQQVDGAQFTRNLAILIGIQDYGGGIPRLTTPVSDATYFAKLLQQRDYGYEVRLLVADVTKASLETLFRDELPNEIGADARLPVYFAGHGVALDGDDGPRGYLVPQNARLDDSSSLLDPSALISMIDLRTCLTNLKCRHMLAILDCCFADAFRWGPLIWHIGALPEVIEQERFDHYLKSPAWQLITSASYDQPALDVLSGSEAITRHS